MVRFLPQPLSDLSLILHLLPIQIIHPETTMRRTTRSQSRQATNPPPLTTNSNTLTTPLLIKNTTNAPEIFWTLPTSFTPKLTGLSRSSTTLLNNKRTKLRTSITRLRRTTETHLQDALDATLVFAQEEAGTAVCISPSGLLLTCSHCVADDEESALNPTATQWLIFARGQVVKAVCVAWDGRRDLALLQITHAEPSTSHASPSDLPSPSFPHVSISPPKPLPLATPLLCIGHPGSEDLEASTPGQATGYDVLHISKGIYHGMAQGQDPQVQLLNFICLLHYGN